MNTFSHIAHTVFSRLTGLFIAVLHRAVVAPRYDGLRPRWRNIGQPVLPYHYLQPAPVAAVKR